MLFGHDAGKCRAGGDVGGQELPDQLGAGHDGVRLVVGVEDKQVWQRLVGQLARGYAASSRARVLLPVGRFPRGERGDQVKGAEQTHLPGVQSGRVQGVRLTAFGHGQVAAHQVGKVNLGGIQVSLERSPTRVIRASTVPT
ncbi:hypothetical protein, partial [Streptomyces sp. NPDC001880]